LIHYEVLTPNAEEIAVADTEAMTAAQTRIAETIDAFYGEAGTTDNVSAYYRQAVEDLDAETVKELVPKTLT